MFSLYFKEINSFFSSLTAYLTIGLFLLLSSLFLFIFPETSLFAYEYATLDSFFTLAPWVFMFLIPAISMRSLAEEFSSGTIELLSTRPISDWQIILAKYFANFTLVVIALLPTLLYYFTIYQLGAEVGNIDTGATNGSYIGLLFLSAIFSAIGLFASSLSSNQIVAFLLGVFLCFFCYSAFDSLSQLPLFYASFDDFIQKIGVAHHYNSISRGVLDTRDLIYFLSLSAWFLILTWGVLQSRKW